MRRIPVVPMVAIPLSRALLCPNDDTVYDAAGWKACPTCANEERVFLFRLLELGPQRRKSDWAKRPAPSFAFSIPIAQSSRQPLSKNP